MKWKTCRTAMLGRPLALALLIGAVGCASTSTLPAAGPQPHENLNSVLWVQTSVEYAAVAEQAYDLAARTLREGMAEPSWTASLEQMEMGGFAGLPPAVVLDVDETVLDNSSYQARLILDREAYSTETWNEWAREAAATAVPGALEFTRFADSLGVTVIYLTNRRSVVEESTRRNLADLGFPLSEQSDLILTRGEKEEWSSSDKTSRRKAVAQQYRIVLLIGDNLGDFLADIDDTPAGRKQAVDPYHEFWGSKWIMLPNPQYGSWEAATIGFDYSSAIGEQLRRKYQALEPAR